MISNGHKIKASRVNIIRNETRRLTMKKTQNEKDHSYFLSQQKSFRLLCLQNVTSSKNHTVTSPSSFFEKTQHPNCCGVWQHLVNHYFYTVLYFPHIYKSVQSNIILLILQVTAAAWLSSIFFLFSFKKQLHSVIQ